jgi:exonuclease SbcC
MKVKDAIVLLDAESKKLSKREQAKEDLAVRISAIEKYGFSSDELTLIFSKYQGSHSKNELINEISNLDAISDYIDKAEVNLLKNSQDVERLSENISEYRSVYPALSDYDFQSDTVLLDEVQSCRTQITKLSKLIFISEDETLNSVQARTQEIKELFSSYISSIEKKDWEDKAQVKISTLMTDIKEKSQDIERMISVINKVNFIIEKRLPEFYTQKFLTDHSEVISEIFGRIHSPKEFSGVQLMKGGLGLMPIRKLDDSPAPITKLSTGQRTALVLSVFIAMNSMLDNAPKILIFDDPVAYVDDLNILSFLDYLRTLTLESDRQIFFATASEKISNHFSSKFDFLPDNYEGFKRVDLVRSSS